VLGPTARTCSFDEADNVPVTITNFDVNRAARVLRAEKYGRRFAAAFPACDAVAFDTVGFCDVVAHGPSLLFDITPAKTEQLFYSEVILGAGWRAVKHMARAKRLGHGAAFGLWLGFGGG
jgi:hypothetical protein